MHLPGTAEHRRVRRMARSSSGVLCSIAPWAASLAARSVAVVRQLVAVRFGRLLSLTLLLAAGASCSRKIGDSCKFSTDCSYLGDRLCDTTQPDGYCTKFNCEPDSCPISESVCVTFTEPSCPNLLSSRRFDRNFCMAPCEDDGDCRGGYTCHYMGNQVVDSNPSSRSVCLVQSASLGVAPVTASAAVCQPGDAAVLTSPEDAGGSVDTGAGGEDAGTEGDMGGATVDTGAPDDASDAAADASAAGDASDGDTGAARD
jgi:hypothetical protein